MYVSWASGLQYDHRVEMADLTRSMAVLVSKIRYLVPGIRLRHLPFLLLSFQNSHPLIPKLRIS